MLPVEERYSTNMSTITIASDREWFGPESRGRYGIYVDGKWTGSLPVRGAVDIEVDDRIHRFQVRQGILFRSKAIYVSGAEDRRFMARVRTGSFAYRMLIGFVKPWTILELVEGECETLNQLESPEPLGSFDKRKILGFSPVLQIIGLVLCLEGLDRRIPALIVIGAIVFLGTIVSAITMVRAIRREGQRDQRRR
jgi:hypothetical protein